MSTIQKYSAAIKNKDDESKLADIKNDVINLTSGFPVPGIDH